MELLDSSRYFLGNPCGRNHSWNETWYCLRFRANCGCVECRREYEQTEAYRESILKHDKSEKAILMRAIYRKSESRTEALKKYNRSDKGKACQARYRATGKDRINHIKYHRTEKGRRTSSKNVGGNPVLLARLYRKHGKM